MNTNSLPHPRYELKHFSGNPRRPWAGVRVEREGAGCEIVTWQFRDPIDAADELLGCAQSEGLPVVMPQYMKDALIAEWQQRGMNLYARGIGREWCGNSYIANGWDVAHAADVEPYRSRMQLFSA
ncbi:MAG TPA: hypothetical protein PL187_04080 [Caldilinea sp.]|nr:hypothetical protein [Caldilinea sp.]